MANRALKSAIAADPSLAGLWGAWLGLAPEAERVEALSRMLEAIPASQRGMVSPVAFALESALGATSPDTLVAAGQTLARALATAPGAEDVSVASIHAPLVTMLEHAMRESGLPDAALGRTIQALGAARFETGDLQDADALLRAAEAVLPASELAPSCYYHSRTLAALGQYEAALAVAKAAQDEDGDVVEYQWQLARCLAAGGHADAARFAFDSLLGSLALDHPYRALVERDRQALSAGEKSP